MKTNAKSRCLNQREHHNHTTHRKENRQKRSVSAGFWQGQKDLNPRHAVLETAALPTELYPYLKFCLFILSFSKSIVNVFLKKFVIILYLAHLW